MTEKKFLLRTNEEVLQRSCSTRSHQSGEKKMLIKSVPKAFICIAVPVGDEIRRWRNKEMSELRQYEEKYERNWKNRG